MNRIYRLVWNRVRGCLVVASEIARARGKHGRSATTLRQRWLLALPLGLAPLFALAASPAAVAPLPVSAAPVHPVKPATMPVIPTSASPSGGQVTAGNGAISQSGLTTTIDQHSQNLSLNWLTFNIGADSTVDFVQPNAQSIAVNRIADPNGSVILGKLNANGQVFLINPNGVLFGQGAQVNVGGLVASTLDVSDNELGSGALHFSGDSQGRMVNQGTINADGGYIALIAAQVVNDGTLSATNGTVAMGGGNAVTLSFDGNRLLGVQVDQSALNALAENNQLIVANGGQVLMSAGAKDALLASTVNNTGVIQAHTVENHAGKIVLLGGMEAGTTNVAGTLDASAPASGDGGFIETSAAHVKVADGTRITTLSTNGDSGTWLIDPQDFTIAASGGDMTGSALSSQLDGGDVTIESSTGAASGNGDIFVNDAVDWNAHTLTLTAARNIDINAVMTAGGSAGLALNPTTANGADAVPNSNTSTVNIMPGLGRVDFTGSGNSLHINGTPYTFVTSLAELQGISGDLAGHYALRNNIDASATAGWNPNGSGGFAGFDPLGNGTPFTGTFDGLGHTIDGLTINRPDTNDVGLFGHMEQNGIVRNVGLRGGSTRGGGNTGALAGYSRGLISHAYATGNVAGGDNVGGLVGYLESAERIDHVYATGDVEGTGNAGGLLGSASNSGLRYAYASGNVRGRHAGGLAGSFVSYSPWYTYATGDVTGTDSAGGLVGTWSHGTLWSSYASGKVTGGPSTQTGGLIGDAEYTSTIRNYWDKDSTGQALACGGAGASECSSIGGVEPIGLSTAAAFQQASYANLNFTSDWYMVDGETRPFLRFEYATSINNAHQLQLVNLDLSARYTLASDVDASMTDGSRASGMWGSRGFVPLGTDGAAGVLNNGKGFEGTFDGLDHTVSGLTIDRPAANNVGLFGYIDNGNIRRLGLLGGSVTGSQFVGGLAGQNKGGTISLSHASGAVTGTSGSVGGLVGSSNTSGMIVQSHAAGTVDGVINVGGLVGSNIDSTVTQSYATAAVSGSQRIGGLVGTNANNAVIVQTYATGAVTGASEIGGLVGYNADNSIVLQNYATGAVTGTSTTGGLVGRNDTGVTDGYWDKQTTGQSTSAGSTATAGLDTLDLIATLPGSFDPAVWGNGDNQTTPYLLGLAGNQVFNKNDLPTGAITATNRPALYTAILDADQLQAMNGDLTGRYLLGNNIDASVTAGWNAHGTNDDSSAHYDGFTPIGSYVDASGDYSTSFTGTLDGLGHVISDLVIDRPAAGNVGLFGYARDSIIRNVGMLGGHIKGAFSVGGLVGTNLYGDISHVFTTGDVGGKDDGGSADRGYNIGGLVGYNLGSITNAYATGNVGGNNSTSVGGLVGHNRGGTITNVYASGKVHGAISNIAGLVGVNITAGASITNGYWNTETSGTSSGTGGSSNGTTSNLKGLTTAELMAALPTGFGGSAWGNGDNQTTPYLLGMNGNQVFNQNDLPTGAVTTTNRPALYTAILDVNQLQAMNGDLAARYVLGNDIDASATSGWNANGSGSFAGFNPIGSNTALFTGVFDGLGYTITGLTIDRPTTDYVGLFGATDHGSMIRNVGLLGVNVRGYDYVGSLLGRNWGTINRAYATGEVHGYYAVGGLLATNTGVVSEAYATSTVSGTIVVGGLIGSNSGTISRVYAAGVVSGADNVGGLAGQSYNGNTSEAYATGTVSGTGSNIGGLIGQINNATITDAYATGAVSGGGNVGGLVGNILSNGGTISQSYATGAVSGSTNLGGLVGRNNAGANGKAINSFYDTVATGQSGGLGTGLNSAQMLDATTFSSWGADISAAGGGSAVWRIYEGHTAPLLRAFMTAASGSVGSTTKTYDGVAFGDYTVDPATITVIPGFWLSGSTLDPGLVLGQAHSNAVNAGSYALDGVGLYSTQMGYDLDFTQYTLTIDPKALTVALTGNLDKTYDGGTGIALTSGNYLLSGFVGNEGAAITQATGNYNSKNVIDADTVTATLTGNSFSADYGTLLSNYVLPTTASGTGHITPLGITVAADANSKIYDATTLATMSLSSSGVLAGDDVVFSGTGSFADKNAGTNKTVTVSSIAISGADADNYSYNITATDTADISQLGIHVDISADDKIYDGTADATAAASSSEILAGDTVDFAIDSASFADKNAGIGKTVTVNNVTSNGADAGNYVYLLDPTATADITSRGITVDASANDKIYDATTHAAVALGSSGILAGDTVNFDGNGSFDNKNAGTGKTVTVNGITASGTDAGNYSFNTTATDTADISQRGITVGATGSNKVYDGTVLGTVTLNGVGVLAGDTVAFTGNGMFADKHVGTAKAVTVSGITATGADAGNYSYNTNASTTADVTQRGVTVDATAGNKVYDATTHAVVALGSTGILAGDTVTFDGTGSFDNKNAGTGKTVTVNGITANGADAGNYRFNTTATDTADISQRGITVDATAGNKVYDATTHAVVALGSTGVLAGDVVSFDGTGNFADKNAGTGKIVTVNGIAASGADAGNYRFNTTATDTADISQRGITVDATAGNKVYDATTHAVVALGSTGVLAGDVVSFDGIGSFADKNAGTDKTVTVNGIAASGADAGNYSFNTSTTDTADISQLGITIDATASDKVYDATTHAIIALGNNGVLAGDTVTLTGTGHFADSNVGKAKAVTVDLDARGADAGNYAFHVAPGTTADITPATLVYQADTATFQLGQAWDSLGGTVSGLVGDDTLAEATDGTLTWRTSAHAASAAGLYAIDGSGLSALNYVFVQAPGNATALHLIGDATPVPVNVPDFVASTIAGLQQSTETDKDRAPYTPDVHVVDGGVRLP